MQYIIYLILLIVCIIGGVVYISSETNTKSSSSLKHLQNTTPTKQPQLQIIRTEVSLPIQTHIQTKNVLPSYVESRSILVEAEDVSQQPFVQRTNNVMSPYAPLPNNVPPSLSVAEHTPASRCPRVNFWCSPLCGLYV